MERRDPGTRRRARRATSRPARASATVATITFVGALLSCADVVVPLPENAVRIDPLEPYALWWAQTEACSGRTGSMGAVEWYVVPDADAISSRIGDAAGYYDRVAGRIVLAGNWSLHGGLVRHEMLHARNSLQARTP